MKIEFRIPSKAILDADVFISYLTGDSLYKYSSRVIEAISTGILRAYTSSELYDDITSALRSIGIPLNKIIEFLLDLGEIPHQPLPTTHEIAVKALKLYMMHGGPRKLHYFDSYHVATAIIHHLPIITSDKYIIENQEKLHVNAINLRKIHPANIT